MTIFSCFLPRQVVPLCGLLLLLGLAAAPSAQTATGRIAGTVLEAATGLPLPGVTVTLAGTARGAISGETGAFAIDDVAVGTYTVRARLLGYTEATQPVTVAAGQTARAAFSLAEGSLALDEIVVKGDAFRPQDAAATADVVSQVEIQHSVVADPLTLIERVPGMDVGGYNQGGTANFFRMRGFGGGGHGSDVAIQIDGIPLNEAEGHDDGYANVDVIVPLEIDRLVAYKGPSSALYGNFARGGTLAYSTRHGGEYRDLQLSGGAFGTLDAQLALGQGIGLGRSLGPLQTNLAFQFYSTNGFADNSRYVRGNVSGRLAYQIDARTDVTLALRGHSSEFGAPGYIDMPQFESGDLRFRQSVNAENDGGRRTFYAERLGVNRTLSENLRLLAFGYAVQQDFVRFAKFYYAPGGQRGDFNERRVYGTGASLNGVARPGGIRALYVVGAEFFSEATDQERFASANRVLGAKTQDRNFLFNTAAAYAQVDLSPSPYFRPSLAVRLDNFTGHFDDADDGSAERRPLDNLSHVSPKVGIRSTVLPGLDLRTSASNGYALPSGTDKYDATFNVDPVEIWQYELGASYAVGRMVDLDLVGFLLDTSGEILESPPGSGLFENVGKTRRRGVEASATARPLAGLELRAAGAVIDTEIRDNPDPALVGLEITSVPDYSFDLVADYTSPARVGGRVRVHRVGPYQTASDNSRQYGGYTVADLQVFYDVAAGPLRRGRLFGRVDNLFDASYAGFISYNPGQGAFLIAPGAPRNVSLGLSVGL